MPFTSRCLPLLIVASAASLAACKDSNSTAPLKAETVAEIAGDSQTVAVGATTANLTVRVFATNGALMPGVTVNWAVAQGSGALSATSSTTDSTGAASVSFTPDAAGTDVVAATTPDVTTAVDFTIVATPPADSTTVTTSGN